MRPEIKKRHYLQTRARIIQAIRDFFILHRYLEVETPVRSPEIIPEAHIDSMMSESWYLQASPELYMKRLLSMGHDRIFQICKCFRKNEKGNFHIPELTLLEWYTAGHSYHDLMNQCRALIRFISKTLERKQPLTYQNCDIHLDIPWEKMTVSKAFDIYSDTVLVETLQDNCFEEVLTDQVEPFLGQQTPTFLYNYPRSLASLAKLNPDDPSTAQRFELYIAGIEIANGFTELNDPKEQALRFEDENKQRRLQNIPQVKMPETFLKSLETMPDSAGIALGVDRLVMIFCDTACIDDVVAFNPDDALTYSF